MPLNLPFVSASPCTESSFRANAILNDTLCHNSSCCSHVSITDVTADTAVYTVRFSPMTSSGCTNPPGVCSSFSDCQTGTCFPMSKAFPKWAVSIQSPFIFIPAPMNLTVLLLVASPVLLRLPLPNVNVIFSTNDIIFVNSTTLPAGLVLDSLNGIVNGFAVAGTNVTMTFFAHDLFTRTEVLVAFVNFDFRYCMPTSCKNGGVCVDPYSANASCDCTRASGVGPLCSVPVAAASSSSSETTGILISVFVGLAIVLLLRVAYVKYARYDQRKTFHVFVSYRVATDVKIAQFVYHKLQNRFLSTGHRVR
jgi:hypothetical protein